MKTAYVSGSMASYRAVKVAQNLLELFDYNITFDWTDESNFDDFDPDLDVKIAYQEARGVLKADTLVLINDHLKSKGKYIEVGMALATGSIVHVIGDQEDSIFWNLEQVIVHRYITDFCEWLVQQKKREEELCPITTMS